MLHLWSWYFFAHTQKIHKNLEGPMCNLGLHKYAHVCLCAFTALFGEVHFEALDSVIFYSFCFGEGIDEMTMTVICL